MEIAIIFIIAMVCIVVNANNEVNKLISEDMKRLKNMNKCEKNVNDV